MHLYAAHCVEIAILRTSQVVHDMKTLLCRVEGTLSQSLTYSFTHSLTHSLTHTPTSARMWVGRRENVKTWIKECVWICEYVSIWDDESVIPSQCKWKYMGVMIDSSLSVIDSATPGPYWWQSVHFPSTALRGNGIAAVNNTERE